jgi:hypothetical protein
MQPHAGAGRSEMNARSGATVQLPTVTRLTFTLRLWSLHILDDNHSIRMGQLSVTLLASKQLAPKPHLRARISVVLLGILDTAIEARKLHGGLVPLDPPLSLHVDGHTAWYTLDLDREVATILVVEAESFREDHGPARNFDPFGKS